MLSKIEVILGFHMASKWSGYHCMPSADDSFFYSKGAVGLLSALNERGKTYGELEEDLNISTSTLTKRINEAIDIGVVRIRRSARGMHPRNEYHLTDMGEFWVEEMAKMGIVSNWQSMRTHQKKLDELVPEFIEFMEEHKSMFLDFPEASQDQLVESDDVTHEVDEEAAMEDAQFVPEDEDSDEGEENVDDSLKPVEVWGEPEDDDGEGQHTLSDEDIRDRMNDYAIEDDEEE